MKNYKIIIWSKSKFFYLKSFIIVSFDGVDFFAPQFIVIWFLHTNYEPCTVTFTLHDRTETDLKQHHRPSIAVFYEIIWAKITFPRTSHTHKAWRVGNYKDYKEQIIWLKNRNWMLWNLLKDYRAHRKLPGASEGLKKVTGHIKEIKLTVGHCALLKRLTVNRHILCIHFYL